MRQTFAALIALLCAGCVSVSGVIPVGKDIYTVSAEMSGNFPSWSEVKQLAMKHANEHCSSLGQYMTIEKWETHGARGWSPLNAELTFRCKAEDQKKG
ncbi:MAG: hypothetical protein ACREVD_10560 [Burkholderiales bacterium]